MKKLFVLLFAPLMLACAEQPDIEGPGVEDEPKGEAGELTSFGFLLRNNPVSLLGDVVTTVGDGEIVCCSPLLADMGNLVATFKVDRGRVYVGDTEQVSGVTANDFTHPVTYRIVTDEGVESEWVVTLSTTGLPVVVINTPNKAAIPPKTEDWLEDTALKIINPDGSIDFEDNVNIRGRGNSTWTFPKKPYAIKLESKASILGMPSHKRWVLLANWLDRTMMRNSISFHIARQTGLEWTPRGEYVEVVLNGRHKGNYYLCEQIKVDKNRVNVASLTDEDVTGGYIMELDVYFDEEYKFHSAIANMPYMFKDPDEVTDAQMAYMQNYVAELEEILYDDARLTAGEYTSYLDVDSFIDWWFVHELTGNSEPLHPKSSYMHKDQGGLLKAGPVWDFDWQTFVPNKSSVFAIYGAIYYGRLFQDRAFVERVKERWRMFKPNFESVPDYILSESRRLKSSAEINLKMWPINVVVNCDESLSFEAAVNRMRTSYINKLNWLDKQIEAM